MANRFFPGHIGGITLVGSNVNREERDDDLSNKCQSKILNLGVKSRSVFFLQTKSDLSIGEQMEISSRRFHFPICIN